MDASEEPANGHESTPPEVARGEIFIGLVGALGTDLELVEHALKSALLRVGYTAHGVRISAEIDTAFNLADVSLPSTAATSLDELMDKGDALRERAGDGGVTAALAISAISNGRYDQLAASAEHKVLHEREATATIIRQLKHPHEVKLLRSVYGPRFLLVGAWAPREERERAVRMRLEQYHQGHEGHWYADHVERLLTRDEKDGLRPLGQRVRDTFELADAYLALVPGRSIDPAVSRLVDLIFGTPFETPTKEEQAMHQAAGARLRSAASGRQVGAAVNRLRG